MARADPAGSERWRLVPYVEASGKSRVMEFLDGLREANPKAYEEFYQIIKPEVEEHGPWATSWWVPVGRHLAEIKWFGPHRLYCSVESDRRVLLYMGVVKRWPKFKTAHRRFCEWAREDARSADYDEESRSRKFCKLREQREKHGST